MAAPGPKHARGRAVTVTADVVRAATFHQTLYRDGYDQEQVDNLLDDVVDVLQSGRHGPHDDRAARYVTDAKFRITRNEPGYDQEEVDDFLDLVVDGLRAAPVAPPEPEVALSSLPIARAADGPVYAIADVENFLDRAGAALADLGRGVVPALDPATVQQTMFRTLRHGEGYDAQEVDQLLDRVAGALQSAQEEQSRPLAESR